MGSLSQALPTSDLSTYSLPPRMKSTMTTLLLTLLVLGSISANAKYALIETMDAPDEPMGMDVGLDEPEEPTGNKIEPAEGEDYCPFSACGGFGPPPFFG